MNQPRSFTLDAITPPTSALHGFSQGYDVITSSSLKRKVSGRGVLQSLWTKQKTTLRGRGWLPAGLDTLDMKVPHTLLCAASQSIQSIANVVVLPSSIRTDAPEYAPQGIALLADGSYAPTSATLGTDGVTLTLTAVAGAVRYQARYWPALQVFLTTLRNNADMSGNVTDWEVVAEEV